MLPPSVVERLVMANGLRFGQTRDERRSNVRYPLRAQAQLYKIQFKQIQNPLRVTMRDISVTGVGIVVPRDANVSEDFILRIDPSMKSKAAPVVLHCRTMRTSEAGSTHLIIGANAVALLAPRQVITVGRLVAMFEWLPTLEETPADPLAVN